jgi:hypothetical protein
MHASRLQCTPRHHGAILAPHRTLRISIRRGGFNARLKASMHTSPPRGHLGAAPRSADFASEGRCELRRSTRLGGARGANSDAQLEGGEVRLYARLASERGAPLRSTLSALSAAHQVLGGPARLRRLASPPRAGTPLAPSFTSALSAVAMLSFMSFRTVGRRTSGANS